MWELLLASENMAFSTALAIMLLIGILEGTASLIGAGSSSFFDSLIPDLDAGTADFGGSTGRFLVWLRIGQVPVLVILILFLTSFGLTGLMLQAAVASLFGSFLPGWLAAIPVLVLSFFLTRFLGGLLHRIIPKDETLAVSRASLIGRVAVITLGTASRGNPAEAKTKDIYGRMHYFLVEPDRDEDVFSTGNEVLIVSLTNHIYRAIPNPSTHLSHSIH
ncbi:YqiJ family protein [Desulfobotulus sp. H1]|uniref:YqiJ family protein n=1 Tax=Desulfobotulus pelophilus TaxID=2823377 RepID=A0ABT3NAB7_9BACT|nr:YqiJ family protein [Desulfobotulus pelophilus]MCW7754398.1 YqiJ family protein [Desulfobotulus pelophilus]